MNALEFFEAFRGPMGICGKLAKCAVEIADGTLPASGGGSSGVRSSNISDPTMRAALTGMARAESLTRRYDELAAQVARAGEIAHAVRHGQVLDDYYLVEDGGRVTWSLLADEYGQTARTLMRWRDAACDEIDRRGLLWR